MIELKGRETQNYLHLYNRLLDRAERSWRARMTPILRAQFKSAAVAVENGRPWRLAVGKQKHRLKKMMEAEYLKIAALSLSLVGTRIEALRLVDGPLETKKTMLQRFWMAIKLWIRYMAARRVKEIQETTRRTIARVVEKGLESGATNAAIAASLLKVGEVASKTRTALIARTETHSALNNANHTAVEQMSWEEGIEIEHAWMNAGDDRVRDTHAEMDPNEWIPKDEDFDVGGEAMNYPGDPKGSAENICNCRCTELFRRAKGD